MDNKTITKRVREFYDNGLDSEMELEDWLEECEDDYHRNVEMDSYFYEIDPIQSYTEGYMESHRREF